MTIIFHGDCRAALKIIPDCTIQTCVTSPPYFGLRDYGREGWGSEINADYIELAKARIGGDVSVIDLD